GPVDEGAAGGPAPLVLLSPANGAAVTGPMELVFSVSGPVLEPEASGWSAAGFHVHAEIDGVERMPATADIRRSGDRYTWTLAEPLTGEVTVRMVWSDARHRPVAEGASEAVTVTI